MERSGTCVWKWHTQLLRVTLKRWKRHPGRVCAWCLLRLLLVKSHTQSSKQKIQFYSFFIYIFSDSKLAEKNKIKSNLILDLISKHLFGTSLTETEVFLFILDGFKPLRTALSTSNISLLGFLAEGERRKKNHLHQICSYQKVSRFHTSPSTESLTGWQCNRCRMVGLGEVKGHSHVFTEEG